jgi:uncharacterized protein YciI
MPHFAVTYTYGVSNDALNEVRPIHRAYLAKFLEQGILLASGPFVDAEGALLIMKADSVETIAELLDQDPFDIAGFISERAITEWNPVFGPWIAS